MAKTRRLRRGLYALSLLGAFLAGVAAVIGVEVSLYASVNKGR